MTVKALLLGLDGGTYTVLDPLMERGVMPFLRAFTRSGVRSTLRTILPPLTPPAWTSLMTGKRPGKHGVFDFFQREAPDSHYLQFSSSQDVGTETIWSLTSERGLRVTSLNFPLMFPPPAVNGSVVPGGWMPWRQLRLGCYPPGLFDRLKSLESFNARELALDMTLEAKAIEGCAEEEYRDWVSLHIRRERRWFDIASYLMREDPAELMGIVFDGVDKLQHLCWRFLDPAFRSPEPTAWEREMIDLCDEYFRQLDGILERLVDLAGPEALVVVASDHGFGPAQDVFFVNAWLEQHGYLAWSDDADVQMTEDAQIGFGQISRHVQQLDWSRTVAYAASPSNLGIHIVSRRPDGSEAVTPERYEALRLEIAAGLRAERDTESGRPVVESVATREEAFAGPYQPMAPDLTLELADGVGLSILPSDELIRGRSHASGNHRWDGIFIAAGPGVRDNEAIDDLSIVDVAPLLLYGLDVPVPSDMDGDVPEQVFVPGQFERHPVRRTEARGVTATTDEATQRSSFDEEDESVIMQRLRALGYVE